MSIGIQCPACKRTLNAPAEMAGRKARCPNCKQPLTIPAPNFEESAAYGLEDDAEFPNEALRVASPLDAINPLIPSDNWSTADLATPAIASGSAPRRASYIAPAVTPTAGRRYWMFSLTLLPLAISLMIPESSVPEPRPSRDVAPSSEAPSSEEAPNNEQPSADGEAADSDDGRTIDNFDDLDLDELVKMFPDNRLPGAHLSRDTWMHWLYALLAGGIFLGLILLLFQQGQATPGQLLGVILLTATCGVLSLIMFQWFATIGSYMRFVGVFGILSLVIRLIGYSYAAALDPENGFVLSLIGFTFGVGLCEEFIKAIPILARFRNEYELDWRGACVWGLASGAGFGAAEGIIYASAYYNGIQGVDAYLVRFVSCVALHAIWSGSVGILLWHHRDAVRGELEWGEWALAILKVQGVVMLLHGLYDTLLKRGLAGPALLVAIASFALLAGLIEWTVRSEAQPARRVRA